MKRGRGIVILLLTLSYVGGVFQSGAKAQSQAERVNQLVERLAAAMRDGGENAAPTNVIRSLSTQTGMSREALEKDFNLAGLPLNAFAAAAVIAKRSNQPLEAVIKLMKSGATPGQIAAESKVDIASIESALTALIDAIKPEATNPLSSNVRRCVNLVFNPISKGDDSYVLKAEMTNECPDCSISKTTAVIALNSDFCKFPVRFQNVGSQTSTTIKVEYEDSEVELKGPDEAALKQVLAQMCEQGGAQIAIDQPIEIDGKYGDIKLEFENGVLRKITGPVPLMARVLVQDSCANTTRLLAEVRPE
jgi:hypothetical protein